MSHNTPGQITFIDLNNFAILLWRIETFNDATQLEKNHALDHAAQIRIIFHCCTVREALFDCHV